MWRLGSCRNNTHGGFTVCCICTHLVHPAKRFQSLNHTAARTGTAFSQLSSAVVRHKANDRVVTMRSELRGLNTISHCLEWYKLVPHTRLFTLAVRSFLTYLLSYLHCAHVPSSSHLFLPSNAATWRYDRSSHSVRCSHIISRRRQWYDLEAYSVVISVRLPVRRCQLRLVYGSVQKTRLADSPIHTPQSCFASVCHSQAGTV